MKSEKYIELQFDLKETQDLIDHLTALIERCEAYMDGVGGEATELRRYRERFIRKAKVIQDKMDYEQLELDL